MADYIALIHNDADSDYSVSFPDFPGCVTAGATIDEARALATEALAFHVEGMREDGQEIPAPSPMAAVMTERENRDAVAFLVTLREQAERHVRVQITLAESLRARDRCAHRQSIEVPCGSGAARSAPASQVAGEAASCDTEQGASQNPRSMGGR